VIGVSFLTLRVRGTSALSGGKVGVCFDQVIQCKTLCYDDAADLVNITSHLIFLIFLFFGV